MAQFKNISGETRFVPGFGDIANLVTITVADSDAEGYAEEPGTWQAMDTAATKAVTALSNTPVIAAPGIYLSR